MAIEHFDEEIEKLISIKDDAIESVIRDRKALD